GGSLVATAKGWRVEFAFPGPDHRYNYTLFKLNPRELGALALAYPSAYRRYRELSRQFPIGSTVTEAFGSHLTIRVNDFADGVCLANYRAPVRTESELQQRLRILQDVPVRGARLAAAALDLSL